jgi:hypothetical protein
MVHIWSLSFVTLRGMIEVDNVHFSIHPIQFIVTIILNNTIFIFNFSLHSNSTYVDDYIHI